MTLGEKLVKLRKENNYTQEQLAELLGVSRQSISKWELNTAYPETEKLIKLSELYECSLDYLLKEKNEIKESASEGDIFRYKLPFFEKKSKRTVNGVPLWHINLGLGRTAKGVIAVGFCAKGLISFGVLSLGIISFGALSAGLLAFGAFALGIVAAGAVSIGIISFGAISVGIIAAGAIAIGQFSFGALSVGNYLAVGDEAIGAIAIGKSRCDGDLYQSSAINDENRRQIISLLDQTVNSYLYWFKEIVKRFI